MSEQTSILRTLTIRTFRKNKGRNLAAALAVLLTSMMFTALFTLAQSMRETMTEMYLRQSGTMAHASTKQITDAQMDLIAAHPDVVSYGKSIVVGLAENESLAGRQVEIRFADSGYAKDSFALPTTGRMPKQADEIALDTLTLERLGIPAELGQSVTLEWRTDLNAPEITADTFTLCGWWEGNQSVYASMAWVSEDYARAACGGAGAPAAGQICGLRMMGISFRDTRNLETKLSAVLSDCGLTDVEFHPNLTYTSEMRQSIFRENLPMYGGMALIFVAGYLIIFNVFQISVGSDIRFYGKLKTLGTGARQLKKLIYGQGRRLSFIGIPAGLILGYLLGVVLVPALITAEDVRPAVSANPVIFIGSALFSYLVVLTSCMLPARLAANVSPIEALRYTDADSGCRKKSKKTKNGAGLPGMAWANLWRNRKRTVLVVCSLTLGLVLMSFFYAKNASFDMEKYLADLTVADFQIDDATNNLFDGYDAKSETINDALIRDIEALQTVEATGRLYSRETTLSPGTQTQSNLKNYYTDERLADFASYDPSFPTWKEGFDAATDGREISCTVYGADGLILDAATGPNYLFDGTFDAEKFSSGNYVLAIGPSIEPGAVSPTFSVGETVTIAGREFEVMAVVTPLQPMVSGSAPAFDLPLICDADTFLTLWPDANLRKFYFNVSDETMDAAASLLTEYRQQNAPGMNLVSRQSMIRQYEAETRASAVMGYAVSFIIALVGILNFINSMVTAIVSRKQELAVIQSIGMTKRQLRSMLAFEGLMYAGMALAASFVLGSATVGILVRGMVAGGFSTFHFTLLPLAVCAPLLLAFAVLIPYLCFRNLEKQSIVERLRAAE